MSNVKELQADVVVVGGGNAGLASSISAAQNGAKVILLEKEDHLGGAARHAEGLFAINTFEEKMGSFVYTEDEMFLASWYHAHGLIDGPLVRTAIKESTETISWIKESTPIKFWLATISPSMPHVWHIPMYKGEERGQALINGYGDVAKELGVDIHLNTSGKKIEVENGEVVGIQAVEADGTPVHIACKAVCLASGGFNNSKEKIAQWTNYDPEAIGAATAYLHKCGEGIDMGIELGAATKGFGLMLFQSLPAEDGNGTQEMGITLAAAGSPVLWVNSDGDRFCNETASFDFPLAGNCIYDQRGHYAWAIWDAGFCQYLKENGLDLGIGTNVPVGTKLDIMADVQRLIEQGYEHVFVADSIPELGEKIGIDGEHLQATVDRYNGFALQHHDDEFYKDPHMIAPVFNPPYIAARLVPGSFISYGGLRVNPETIEVIDEAGNPVAKGVYACGADVGGMWGDTYEVRRSGAMMGWASTSGRIAGKNAAEVARA